MLNFLLYQPLEQFEIFVFNPFIFSWIEALLSFIFNVKEIYLTNSILYSIFGILSLYFFMYISIQDRNILPHNPWETFLEATYFFIYTTLTDQATKSRATVQLVPFTFTLFFFILSANLIGLTPYGFTTTSFIVKTFILSAGLLIGLTLVGLILQGKGFFSLFVPSGVPTALLPMLVFIEVVSYVSRAFSLAIRLFANMMSGHSLLNILSGFCVSIAKKSYILALIPFSIILAISFLEVGIAILQAYVFVVLFCIYLNDALFGHSEEHHHDDFNLENSTISNVEQKINQNDNDILNSKNFLSIILSNKNSNIINFYFNKNSYFNKNLKENLFINFINDYILQNNNNK